MTQAAANAGMLLLHSKPVCTCKVGYMMAMSVDDSRLELHRIKLQKPPQKKMGNEASGGNKQ